MGEPNVNYNSKSKREVIRGRWRSEEDGEGERERRRGGFEIEPGWTEERDQMRFACVRRVPRD